ncbi:MAG TPA: phosphopantetheine-binding protein, partial [Pyrinomonadaceae bacterium]|nr:phosphopantetheine-binding protein [Pyrinomonadaceae bacterium]
FLRAERSLIIHQYPSAAGAEPPVTINFLRHSYETHSDLAYVLQGLGKLWLLGARPDWTKFYAQERRRRVLLPAYPFQRRRYWIDAQVDQRYIGEHDESQKQWLYVPSWKRTSAATATSASPAKNWWVLVDKEGFGDAWANALERNGRNVTRLHAGSGFTREGPSSFTVSPARQEDYSALIDEAGGPPEAVVHLWDLENSDEGASGLLALASAIQDREDVKALPVWVVSAGVHDVSGEETLQPSQASLLGACAAAAKESPKLSLRNLDVVSGVNGKQRLVEQLLKETANGAGERVVAYRGGHRWVPTLAPASTNGDESTPVAARTYLLINALGSLGANFTQQLAREADHRLVLVEATDFPARELWDEWVANDSGEGLLTAKIKRLRELEKQTDVLLLQADLSIEAQARALSKQVKDRFGSLDGVVYIFDETLPSEHTVLKDKVQGLATLDEILRDEDLSCRLIVSRTRTDGSLSAADSAVRFFVDAFASDSARNGRQPWTSITWDFAPVNGNGRLDHPVEHLLHLGAPQVIVSSERLTEGWNKLEALMNGSAAKTERQPITTYARPTLRVAYVAPRTPAEQSIAEIWSELLGIEQIGAHDSFLELGGDSLLAVRLISRLRDVFDQNIPLRLIFEASTVAELAKAIEPRSEEREDSELAEIMSMLEQLSEEETERELLKRQQALTSEATA